MKGNRPILDFKLPSFKLDIPFPKMNHPDAPPVGVVVETYRTPAKVVDEPCGSCVRDMSKPNVRVGYADPDAPMMLRCDACSHRWIDPAFEQQVRETEEKLQELHRQNVIFQKQVDRMIDDALSTESSWRRRSVMAIGAGIVIAAERVIHFLFP